MHPRRSYSPTSNRAVFLVPPPSPVLSNKFPLSPRLFGGRGARKKTTKQKPEREDVFGARRNAPARPNRHPRPCGLARVLASAPGRSLLRAPFSVSFFCFCFDHHQWDVPSGALPHRLPRFVHHPHPSPSSIARSPLAHAVWTPPHQAGNCVAFCSLCVASRPHRLIVARDHVRACVCKNGTVLPPAAAAPARGMSHCPPSSGGRQAFRSPSRHDAQTAASPQHTWWLCVACARVTAGPLRHAARRRQACRAMMWPAEGLCVDRARD